MTTFAIHGEIEKYDNAHLEFYALLSLKASRALVKHEKDQKCLEHIVLIKALIKYNPIIQVDEKGRKKDGQASWLEGPTYIALGAAAIPAILLARRISQSFNH